MKTYKILLTFFLILISGMGFSQSVPSYVPNNGLVGWWGFNGNAQDGSGNGNHGTVNGATLTTDRFGNQNQSFQFDLDDITTPIYNSQFLNDFTISLWVIIDSYSDSTNNYPTFIWAQNAGLVIQAEASNGLTRFNSYFLNNYGIGGSQVEDGHVQTLANISIWNHVLLANEDGINKLYVNGILTDVSDFASTIQGVQSGSFLKFGHGGINLSERFFGKLDDIGIWNRALTPQEITNLYNSQLPTQTSLCLPTITTSSPSSVGVDTVVIGGDISNDGGSSIVLRGVCYSTSTNPNMGNQRTEDGSGIGSFNTVLRGLTSSTTYYARSYAKNSNGVVVYGNEVSISTSSINIGSNYAGGIVFYVDGTGQHGLVCAPNDQGTLMWGCTGTDIAGNSTAFGTGQTNTNLILAGCSDRPIAASVCDDLVLNGYSDWYLPSLAELQLMYTNLRAQGIGGFSYATYWSSSQEQYFPSLFSLCMNFDNGYVYNTAGKNFSNQVRAVRAF